LQTAPSLPGEEALYGTIKPVLDAAAKDPQVKATLQQNCGVEQHQGQATSGFEGNEGFEGLKERSLKTYVRGFEGFEELSLGLPLVSLCLVLPPPSKPTIPSKPNNPLSMSCRY
jgi:hypothetical protein